VPRRDRGEGHRRRPAGLAGSSEQRIDGVVQATAIPVGFIGGD
jgi:hypothetical protein